MVALSCQRLQSPHDLLTPYVMFSWTACTGDVIFRTPEAALTWFNWTPPRKLFSTVAQNSSVHSEYCVVTWWNRFSLIICSFNILVHVVRILSHLLRTLCQVHFVQAPHSETFTSFTQHYALYTTLDIVVVFVVCMLSKCYEWIKYLHVTHSLHLLCIHHHFKGHNRFVQISVQIWHRTTVTN
jgi:hypothetical protein